MSGNTDKVKITGEGDENSAINTWPDYYIDAPFSEDYDTKVSNMSSKVLCINRFGKPVPKIICMLCFGRSTYRKEVPCEEWKQYCHFQTWFIST